MFFFLERISIFLVVFYEAQRPLLKIGHRRVRVPDARQIGGARFSEQEVQHRIVAFLLLEARYAAFRVQEIAEYQRPRRTSLLAGALGDRPFALPEPHLSP